jgi:penicillin-binding protein 1A
MIEMGYCTRQEAEKSFTEYWDNYDYTRASRAAYFNREDKAPWFSEYVRRRLDDMMYGSMDYYRDGYTVLTTLNMKDQEAAEKYMAQGLVRANREYKRSQGSRLVRAERTYKPVVDMVSLLFDLRNIHFSSSAQAEERAKNTYIQTINPIVDLTANVFGLHDLKVETAKGFNQLKTETEKNVVEGALICLQNDTGYITALVGGSKYDMSNQLIRATQAKLQPGSAFKPLYYSAAIDTRLFTPATLIYDIPIVFHNEDGTPYIPLNFRGEWKGSLLLYQALAHSMNVASLKVLDAIGFDAAINRAAALLGITDPAVIARTFPRVYPLGLGIISVAPIQMARAFAIFANQGRDVEPIAIRAVEDRNGRVIMDPERDLRLRQKRMGSAIQVISPQNAYIMDRMLQKTVQEGTLAAPTEWGRKNTYLNAKGKKFIMPWAGKTGTPQNWSDAWTVGFSAYYTTAIWFGFDKPGNSLGVNLTGSTLAGPVWADYMRAIHAGLPYKNFEKPATGIVEAEICTKTGLLATPYCPRTVMPFLAGTQPTKYCDKHHGPGPVSGNQAPDIMRFDSMLLNSNNLLRNFKMPHLPKDIPPAANNNPPAQ